MNLYLKLREFKSFSALPKILFLFIWILSLAGCSSISKKPNPLYKTIHREHVQREFRAVWVATVANINWPSEPGLDVAEQKRQVILLLDLVEKNNLNAVIFQVRPQADALYQSHLEPWSYYLTGVQGKAPEPFYDPLQFWLEQAHQRGIELHAWINPYRAHHIAGGELSELSIVNTKPDLIVPLKNGYYWMDPTHPKTIEHSLAVVMDIVRNYDIDGIHLDDYFYPYPSYNQGEQFPDAKRYLEYTEKGGELTRDDWRRDAVNDFVKRLYGSIKKEKRHVKLGISPFGIWRPNQPETIRGLDQYDQLYADAKLWLNEGWLDYFTPQLYWKINQYSQSYPLLLNWWQQENTKNRHLWPGMSTYQTSDSAGIDEIINQIMIGRGMLMDKPGMVFWSIDALQKNLDFNDALRLGAFQHKALIPASPWLDLEPPEMPKVVIRPTKDFVALNWFPLDTEDVFNWLVYYKYDDVWQYKILPENRRSLELPAFNAGVALVEIAVIAVDRNGNESKRVNRVLGARDIQAALQ
ncbi:glycoside hydrolase family 10 protein [Colwellia piezophila]|uniref:glycoside hydrolase family 10 protein n=1 Tax=Colwellia piezophila TaxID=211668 RepID=UPI000370A1CD|nr:family 10 glycosylhydrolase [Colwellia piezophila]